MIQARPADDGTVVEVGIFHDSEEAVLIERITIQEALLLISELSGALIDLGAPA